MYLLQENFCPVLENLNPLLEFEDQVVQRHRHRMRKVEILGEHRLHLVESGVLRSGRGPLRETLGGRRRQRRVRHAADVLHVLHPDAERRHQLVNEVQHVQRDLGLVDRLAVLERDGVALGQALATLPHDLLAPVLEEPVHGVGDALQGGEHGHVDVALALHYFRAGPHLGGGFENGRLRLLGGLLGGIVRFLLVGRLGLLIMLLKKTYQHL